MVFFPYCSLIPLATGIVYSHVWKRIVPTVRYQPLGKEDEKLVPQLCSHDIVAQRSVASVGYPSGIIEKRGEVVEATLFKNHERRQSFLLRYFAYIVQIEVDAALMAQDEVFQRIHPLDGELVAIVGTKKPRVFSLNKLPRLFLCP